MLGRIDANSSTIRPVSADNVGDSAYQPIAARKSSDAGPAPVADNSDTANQPTAANNHGTTCNTTDHDPDLTDINCLVYHEERIDWLTGVLQREEQWGCVETATKWKPRLARLQTWIQEGRAEYESKQKRKARCENKVTKSVRPVARKKPESAEAKEARKS